MLPAQKQTLELLLADTVKQVAEATQGATEAAFVAPTITLERPKVAAHGDIACNVAMQLAKPLRANPRQLAQQIVDAVLAHPQAQGLVQGAEVAGPGFINLRLSPAAKQAVIGTVFAEQQAFGRIFRIGQQKETYMTRIAVRNSIDMRLLSMQLYKMSNVENAIGESAQKRPTLGLADLTRLFGFLKTGKDDEDILEIGTDYSDEDDDPQDMDQPMASEPMGGEGVHVREDWSFGEENEQRSKNHEPATMAEAESESEPIQADDCSSEHVIASHGDGSGLTCDDPMEID